MENCLADSTSPFRGHSGPLQLERGPVKSPLFTAFFKSTVQAGYPRTEDVNGYKQEGFAAFDRNVRRGRRLSAARAYLHPVMSRPNLTVKTKAFVTRVLFEDDRAIGVEVEIKGKSFENLFTRNYFVWRCNQYSADSSLSGVGRREDLEKLGIEVVKDLPGVGANLQDHLEVYVQYRSKQPVSMQPMFEVLAAPFYWR